MAERDQSAQSVPPASPDAAAEPPAGADAPDELLVLARLLSEESATSREDERDAADTADDETESSDVYLVADRFEIVEAIGSGPRGSVFRARDHDNQERLTALKILKREPDDAVGAEDRLARAQELFRAVSRLDAQAITRLRDVGRTEDGRVWLASDLVEGESVRQLFDRTGALPPRHALEIVRQILLGLEKGHAAGRAHGRLVAGNVLLAKRVEWTEANPFGVGVRLTDYGLSELDDDLSIGGPGEAKAADLLATGVLLAELLTGTRIASDGSDWIGSDAAVTTSAMSASARRLVDTALVRDPNERFADATTFRRALESTPEWRPRPKGRAPQFVVIVLLAAIAGYFAWQAARAKELVAAPPSTPSAIEASTPPPPEVADARERLESDLARVSELVEVTRGELASERDVGAAERSRAERAEAERRQIEAESAARERELQEALERMQAELRELEAAAQRPAPVTESLPPAATPADELLRALEEGRIERARGFAETLARETAPDANGANGANELGYGDALVDAADAVERVATTLDPWEGIQLSSATRLLLERVRGQAGDATATEPWRGRGATLDALFERFDRRLREAEARFESGLERRWTEFEATPDRDPSEVLRIVDYFHDGRLPGFLTRYSRWLSARAEPDGLLDWDALATVASLGAWSEFVATSELEHADAEVAAAGRTIQSLAYAARFGAPDEAAFPGFPDSTRALFADARDDWREELGLRAGLLAEGSGALSPPGSSYLYFARTASGEGSWRWDVWGIDPEPAADAEVSRSVTQRFFDERGVERGERTLRVLRIGRALFEEDVRRVPWVVLDRTVRPLEIKSWSLGGFPDPPPTLGVSAAEIAAFRDRLAADRPRCLVVSNGPERRWWSPELGLVRHADPTLITVELVYASER